MSILNKVKRGRIGRPQKVVIYAPEGFGKSTLASQFPDPLFLDVEDSTAQMDVARLGPDDLPTLDVFLSAVAEAAKGGACSTLVVDTIDWLEELTLAAVIADAGNPKIKGVEDFGYGKGYTALKEKMTLVLQRFDAAISAGVNVVLLAHSHVKRFDPPDGANPFDRYELKLSKQVAPLVKEWADMLLFGNWRVQLRERDDGKVKGVGGRDRLLYATRCAAWDAKNRHGMGDSEKWDIATIRSAFERVAAPWGNDASGATNTTKADPKHEKASGDVDQAQSGRKPSGVAKPSEAVTKAATVKEDTIPGDKIDAELTRICEPHAEAVTAYLLANGKIAEGEGWADMPADFAARVKKNPARFLEVVKAHGKEAA